jgi:hypothetical protein
MRQCPKLHTFPNGNVLFHNGTDFLVMEVDAMRKPSGLRHATKHEIAIWRKANRKKPYKQRFHVPQQPQY